MRRLLSCGVIVCFGFVLFAGAGCTQKAASVSEVIQVAQSLPTVQAKADYMMKQAEAFYNSKEFQQAIDIAQYVLSKVDSNSAQAKDLIAKAKSSLQAAAQKAAGDVSNKLFGK